MVPVFDEHLFIYLFFKLIYLSIFCRGWRRLKNQREGRMCNTLNANYVEEREKFLRSLTLTMMHRVRLHRYSTFAMIAWFVNLTHFIELACQESGKHWHSQGPVPQVNSITWSVFPRFSRSLSAMTMRSAVVFAAFSVVLPASVHSQVVRNAYSEANFLGATTFLKFIDKSGLSTLLKDPRGDFILDLFGEISVLSKPEFVFWWIKVKTKLKVYVPASIPTKLFTVLHCILWLDYSSSVLFCI